MKKDIHDKLKIKFTELREIAKNKFSIDVPVFFVRDDIQSHRVFGQLRTDFINKKYTIRLNKTLLEEQTDLYIDNTVVHEFAHLVTNLIYGRSVKSHGKEWKSIAKELGLKNPKSTNSLYTLRNRVEKFVYVCGCKDKEHSLTKIRHNKILKRINVYSCIICSQDLKYLKTIKPKEELL
jgi:SprT protein